MYGYPWDFVTVDFWDSKSPEYPHKAVTLHPVNPRMVDENEFGHFIYRKAAEGKQDWGFRTEDARDKFCKKYGGVSA